MGAGSPVRGEWLVGVREMPRVTTHLDCWSLADKFGSPFIAAGGFVELLGGVWQRDEAIEKPHRVTSGEVQVVAFITIRFPVVRATDIARNHCCSGVAQAFQVERHQSIAAGRQSPPGRIL